MISFAAICPHTPLLLQSIGKENQERAKKTLQSFDALGQNLAAAAPDCLLLISPHGHIEPGLFTLDLCRQYQADLTDFGDFGTKTAWPAAFGLAREIDAAFINEPLLWPTSPDKLDYGTFVPLMLLGEAAKNLPILPLHYSNLDVKAHFEFGRRLGELLINSSRRIALVASGDLAHTHSADTPAGYSPKAAKFDRNLVNAIKNKNKDYFLDLDRKPELSAEVKDCGLRSFALLLGVLDAVGYTPEVLSYEAPFGVGYLTAFFRLS